MDHENLACRQPLTLTGATAALRNLMAKQDLAELGFRKAGDKRPSANTTEASERRREGFVAGVRD